MGAHALGLTRGVELEDVRCRNAVGTCHRQDLLFQGALIERLELVEDRLEVDGRNGDGEYGEGYGEKRPPKPPGAWRFANDGINTRDCERAENQANRQTLDLV